MYMAHVCFCVLGGVLYECFLSLGVLKYVVCLSVSCLPHPVVFLLIAYACVHVLRCGECVCCM